MSSIAEQKELLRQTFLEKRGALSPETVLTLSQGVQERLLSAPIWSKKERVALYSPIRNEVATMLLFMRALEDGRFVYFPRVEQGIRFYEVKDPADLQKGAWGILEPKAECAPLPDDCALDLLIVPGVVFDRKGYRLGYGKGFYDAVLERYPSQTAGLAYDFQVVDALPLEPWDRKVRCVITDKKEYAT